MSLRKRVFVLSSAPSVREPSLVSFIEQSRDTVVFLWSVYWIARLKEKFKGHFSRTFRCRFSKG